MIVIDNTGANTVYLTLSENTTVSAPVYSFSATAKDTNVTVEFDLTILDSNSRWDVATIDGTLFEEGQHVYEVTEKTESKIVERGQLIVNDPSQTTGWDSYVQYDDADEETRGRL
jgi:hypothetical protein